MAHTHEEIVGVGVGTANLEQLHQVVELAVNITTDSNWAFLGRRISSRPCFVGARINIPLAGHLTLPAKLLAPRHDISIQPLSRDHARATAAVFQGHSSLHHSNSTENQHRAGRLSQIRILTPYSAHLLTESLDVGLSQLFAAHQALNPTIESGNRGGLDVEHG